MRILLSGPPLVGKSTQARSLALRFCLPHVSSGDLIRSLALSGDPDAVASLAIVADGSLAPSDAVVRIVGRRLSREDCRDGYVVDGFPRKAGEARALFGGGAVLPQVFLVLSAGASELEARLEDRVRQSSFLRDDDRVDVMRRRLSLYESETVMVADAMDDLGVPVMHVDACGDADEVQRLVEAALGRLFPEGRREPELAFAPGMS